MQNIGTGESDCVKSRREKQAQNRLGQHIPTCNADGSYETVQCHASTGYCWCVDGRGQELDGTRLRFQKPNCPAEPACRRERNEAERRQASSPFPIVGAFIPECEDDGSYKPKQCHGSTGQCWCTTPEGKEIEGTRQRGNVECAMGACHMAKQEAESRGPLPGLFVPQCNDDGTFQAKQCHGSTGYCWCATPEGTEIEGTKQFGSSNVNCASSKTDCQRKKEAGDLKSSRGVVGHFTPSCEADGSFSKVQCHGSTGYCWCAEADGREVEGTRKRFSEPNCDAILGSGGASGKCEEAKAKAEASGDTPVECDEDGFFKDKQCQAGWFSTTCWCVNQDGEEIEGSRGDSDIECQRVPGKQSKWIPKIKIITSLDSRGLEKKDSIIAPNHVQWGITCSLVAYKT